VGTTTPVTGAITNDDIVIYVDVSPSSVVEDGSGKLTYTFTRSGGIAEALGVNFTVGGSASFGADYTQTGAGTFTSDGGSVVFPAGSNTVSVVVDPTSDLLIEQHETVVFTIVNLPGYVVIGQPATGTITNDDVEVSVTPATVSISRMAAV
jgi:hypothetical protein